MKELIARIEELAIELHKANAAAAEAKLSNDSLNDSLSNLRNELDHYKEGYVRLTKELEEERNIRNADDSIISRVAEYVFAKVPLNVEIVNDDQGNVSWSCNDEKFSKIKLIIELRSMTNCGLRAAKDAIDRAAKRRKIGW